MVSGRLPADLAHRWRSDGFTHFVTTRHFRTDAFGNCLVALGASSIALLAQPPPRRAKQEYPIPRRHNPQPPLPRQPQQHRRKLAHSLPRLQQCPGLDPILPRQQKRHHVRRPTPINRRPRPALSYRLQTRQNYPRSRQEKFDKPGRRQSRIQTQPAQQPPTRPIQHRHRGQPPHHIRIMHRRVSQRLVEKLPARPNLQPKQ